MTVQIIHGDCRSAIEFMPSNSIHSIVTDPPYALVSIQKRFGKEGSAPAKDVYGRASAGFMGKTWDTGETAFDPAFWADVWRVLRPGGHVLAFGGTRTYHRLASAIEDAGFEIRDQIGWVYGSGFPKSHNMDGEWEGWGTALKPAWEPIVVARKPLDGTNAENLARWGVGALNIDGCRVPTDEETRTINRNTALGLINDDAWRPKSQTFESHSLGRWPANVIHDGSDEVIEAFPSTAPSKRGNKGLDTSIQGGQFAAGKHVEFVDKISGHDDAGGSAARFFYCAKASKKDRDDGLEDFDAVHRPNGNKWTDQDYRVSSGERPPSAESGPRKNVHPTVKPTELMRYLCRLVTPPGGTVLDPFMGSGSTGRGAVLEGFNFIGCEMEAEYAAIARARIAAVEPHDGVFA